jgi:hypothetical protein
MYERIKRPGTKSYGYAITSPLSADEVIALRLLLEQAIRRAGKIRVLFELRSQPYGDFDAFWEDLKFDVKHTSDLERVAVIGDSRWEKAAVKVFDTFTPVQCRYFERGQEERALAWIEG